MQTDIHFTSYLAQFLLEFEMFRANFIQKIKTRFMFDNFFVENPTVYEIMWNNIAQRGRTHDNITRHMRIACWIPKATNTLSKYLILIASHCNISYMNPSQYYITHKFPVLLISCHLAYRGKVAVSPQSSAHTRTGMSAKITNQTGQIKKDVLLQARTWQYSFCFISTYATW
jgi:hypothetical protein